MSLRQWLVNGWLKPHVTDSQEIGNLLAMVDRDISDASKEAISTDWRFGIAYNAALKLCTILLFIHGFRPENTLAHYRSLLSLPYTLGREWQEETIFLNACRMKRNMLEYDCCGNIKEEEVSELLQHVLKLKHAVIAYLLNTGNLPQNI